MKRTDALFVIGVALVAACIVTLAWQKQQLESEAVRRGYAHFNPEREFTWNTSEQ